MDKDPFSKFTSVVKEEAIERYLTERRLVEQQIEIFQEQVKEVLALGRETGKRLAQLAYLLIDAELGQALVDLLNIPSSSPWEKFPQDSSLVDLNRSDLHGLTRGRRYRGAVLAAYGRLHQHMEDYKHAFEDLEAEAKAINTNIEQFERNFSLLDLMEFLKSLDVETLGKAQILGGNFTAEELSAVEEKFHFSPISFPKEVILPLPLPQTDFIRGPLRELASLARERWPEEVKERLRRIENTDNRAHDIEAAARAD